MSAPTALHYVLIPAADHRGWWRHVYPPSPNKTLFFSRFQAPLWTLIKRNRADGWLAAGFDQGENETLCESAPIRIRPTILIRNKSDPKSVSKRCSSEHWDWPCGLNHWMSEASLNQVQKEKKKRNINKGKTRRLPGDLWNFKNKWVKSRSFTKSSEKNWSDWIASVCQFWIAKWSSNEAISGKKKQNRKSKLSENGQARIVLHWAEKKPNPSFFSQLNQTIFKC